ncbi:uncharacterized protein N7446_005087 [Penicillium canescens]|uniref:uncharacterized protein n=1 Tax=Penicillium canescens TaxID=5083 RepID=UPI0026E0545F|nr:uncharacterized protein N7446_005087 [Penicillium canescens]KAJ6068050.1 hypothetical protein N7446_005087 [Penicillium canescens]
MTQRVPGIMTLESSDRPEDDEPHDEAHDPVKKRQAASEKDSLKRRPQAHANAANPPIRRVRFREDEDCARRKIEYLEGEVEALKKKVQVLMKKWDFVEPFLEAQCKAEGVSTPKRIPVVNR